MPRVIERSAAQARDNVELDDSESEGDGNSEPEIIEEDVQEEKLVVQPSPNQHTQRQRHARTRGAAAEYTTAAALARKEGQQVLLSTLPGASDTPLPEKSGWVEKASSSWFAGFQRRWLVVKDKQVRWYESPDEQSPHGVIDFDLLEIEIERLWSVGPGGALDATKSRRGCCSGVFAGGAVPVNFRVCPANCNRAFEVRVGSAEEGEQWVATILQHITAAEQRTNLRIPCQLDASDRTGRAWWKVQRISANEFVNLADTGDILLFRSKGVFGRLIRAAHLRARYDHVGLLVRLGDGNLGVLEATGDSGVDILPWSSFLENEYQDLYPELALRRVHFVRDPARLQALQTWVQTVIGKPYGLGIGKLSSRNSVSMGGQDLSSDFFCSQLVAEALKVLGVMARGRSSTQYWPSSFSAQCPSQSRLACCEGCSYDNVDLVIDFKL